MSGLRGRALPAIDGQRVLDRLAALARIGRDPRGGLSRTAFGEADRRAGQALRTMAEEAGLLSTVDPAGNILIRRRPPAPGRRTLLIGSHLDTVVNGGWLDGSYGVVAALEVLQSSAAADADPDVDLVAVSFANEEGAVFRQPFWGSLALSGLFHELPDDPVDVHGNPLAPALAEAGGCLARLSEAAWNPDDLIGYLELHIEQGPALEQAGVPVGVVDGIVGRSVWEVDVAGRAGHAGTTPMAGRRDAAVGAARLLLAVEDLARGRNACTVATTGCVEVSPNSPNTIAGQATLTVDLRDLDDRRLTLAEEAFRAVVAEVGHSTGLLLDARRTTRSLPVATDPLMHAAVTRAADRCGLQALPLSSGAGHDAQVVGRVAPMGMIFAPSRGGVSHVPEEDTAPSDLVAGARTLAAAVEELLCG